MTYVFDTNAFITLFASYYRDRFPTLWNNFDELVVSGDIVSTREVLREIQDQTDDLTEWARQQNIFLVPIADEGKCVAEIYAVPHFQANIEQKKLLKGGKNADPFVVAKARVIGGTVVTMEKRKPRAAKIPNICDYFNVPCLNLEGFMEAEGWQF